MALNGSHSRHLDTDGDDRDPRTAFTPSAPEAAAGARLQTEWEDPVRLAGREVSTSGRRVLLVDDDPILADMVLRYLRREGYEVEWLTDGKLVELAVAADPLIWWSSICSCRAFMAGTSAENCVRRPTSRSSC